MTGTLKRKHILSASVARDGSLGTNLGDNFSFNSALAYHLGDEEHDDAGAPAHGHASWDFIVEFNGEWQEREVIGDEEGIHSGGTQLFITPGIRFNSGEG